MRNDSILKEVENLQTLGDVMKWVLTRRPTTELVNVVTQDEFTHDVVIRVSPQVFLVFDTN